MKIEKLTILNLVTLFTFIVTPAIAIDSNFQESVQQEAEAIEYYAIGQYRQAITIWERLLTENKDLNPEKITEISILIASAQEFLGFPREACFTLQKVIKANPYLCDLDFHNNSDLPLTKLSLTSSHEVIAAITLANLQRDFGKFEQAKILLNVASQQAHKFNDKHLITGVKISKADLNFMQIKLEKDHVAYRNLQLGNDAIVELEVLFSEAYQSYAEAFESTLQHDALLKWLRLHEENQKFQPFLASSTLIQTSLKQYHPNLDKLLNLNLTKATEVEKIQYKLDVAQRAYEFGLSQHSQSALIQAFALASEALKLSSNIGNRALLGQAYGQVGKLYSLSKQPRESKQAFKQAINYAQDDPSRLYKWQYEIAKILREQGENDQAALYFESAIETLKEVEWNTSTLSSELRINFQEQSASVFNDYLEMLLDSPNPHYQKVLRVQRKLATSELQNYLGCGTLQTISVKEIFHEDENAIFINIFQSGNHYYTIIEFGNDETITAVNKITVAELKPVLNQTRFLLDADTNPPISSLKDNLKQLYNQIITPLESELETGKTLVFSVDPSFQQIPLGMLFDGQQYLIEKHPVTFITPQLNKPVPIDSKTKKNVFFAGLSQPQNSQGQKFPALLYVEQEAKTIQPKKKILNQAFTQQRFLEQLAQEIPIFHVATHGQFSSDPKQTFILAWDQKITLNALTSVVGYRAQNTPKPIELLILSACETAKGDPLAALGLAGITVQAGARSTLASLWQSQDESSALLMEDFYQFFREGHGKAKALQLAQIEQIKQGLSPYNWGNFVLVGSWL